MRDRKAAICDLLGSRCEKCGVVKRSGQLAVRMTGGKPRNQKEAYQVFLKRVEDALLGNSEEACLYALWCGDCILEAPKHQPRKKPATDAAETGEYGYSASWEVLNQRLLDAGIALEREEPDGN